MLEHCSRLYHLTWSERTGLGDVKYLACTRKDGHITMGAFEVLPGWLARLYYVNQNNHLVELIGTSTNTAAPTA